MSYSKQHLREASEIVAKLDPALCEKAVELLAAVRARGGRLFILGVGGSAANASHAVNDFRKLAGIEAYAPTDNVSELTARTNDDGWPSVFAEWLKGSRLNGKDAILVLSVGGGSLEKNVSPNLVSALQLAKERVARSWGSWAATEDTPRRLPTWRLSSRQSIPQTFTPHTRRSKPWCGICGFRIPLSKSPRRNGKA
jgi:Phosphoheptose isomerase